MNEDVETLKMNTNEATKSNKCNQCNYASSYASALRTHLKHIVEKSQTSATNVTLASLTKALADCVVCSVHLLGAENLLRWRQNTYNVHTGSCFRRQAREP